MECSLKREASAGWERHRERHMVEVREHHTVEVREHRMVEVVEHHIDPLSKFS